GFCFLSCAGFYFTRARQSEMVARAEAARAAEMMEMASERRDLPAERRHRMTLYRADGSRRTGGHMALADVIQEARDGDVIELESDGPYVCQPATVRQDKLTIRAAEGRRPVVELDDRAVVTLQDVPGRQSEMRLGGGAARAGQSLFTAAGRLVLEGVE